MEYLEPDSALFEGYVESCTPFGGMSLEPFAHSIEENCSTCAVAAVTSRSGEETEQLAVLKADGAYILSNTFHDGQLI